MSRFLILVHGILVVLFVFLTPLSARSQEQNQQIPAIQQVEKPLEEPAVMKDPEGAIPEQGVVLIPESENTIPAPAGETRTANTESKAPEGVYTIKQGDTLWDISNTFLKDPFLWPFIWKANTYITNADLIYPGNKLLIPNMEPIERAMQAAEPQEEFVEKQAPDLDQPGREAVSMQSARAKQPTEPESEEPVSTSRLILPDAGPVPIIDKYSLLSAGYVGEDAAQDTIIGGPEGKTIYGFDDLVYVKIRSKEDVNIGDKFIMYKSLNKVKHPATGGNYGKLIKVIGILQVAAKNPDGTYTSRITLSFDASVPGSTRLIPYQEPVLTYESKEKKNKDISGYILEVMDTRTINAQIDIVYLDKGSSDGVEPGDRFLIYTVPTRKMMQNKMIGETQVILVKERTATAIVRRSTESITKGDRIEFKK